MKVEITLNNEEGHPVLIINNSENPDMVSIRFIDDDENDYVDISVEDFRLALRKIFAK